MYKNKKLARIFCVLLVCVFPITMSCSDDDDGFNFFPGLFPQTRFYAPPEATANRVTGSLNQGRSLHTATILLDGRVLVTGGWDGSKTLDSCELYNPETEEWSFTASLSTKRQFHTATLLMDGRVFITGGSYTRSDGKRLTLSKFEIFDPVTETWSDATAYMRGSRTEHCATSLADRYVLITAGYRTKYEDYQPVQPHKIDHRPNTLLSRDLNGDYLSSFEIFDHITNTSYSPYEMNDSLSGVNHMNYRRSSHTATLLNDNRVLVAGGYGRGRYEEEFEDGGSNNRFLNACEIYNPDINSWTDANIWTETDSLEQGRSMHTATLLKNGRVLIAGGGYRDGGSYRYRRTCETFNPENNSWSATGEMREERKQHTAILLNDGRVLIAGNTFTKTTEIYNPDSETWNFGNEMLENRQHFPMITFSNGIVLISGGVQNGPDIYHTSCELYLPYSTPVVSIISPSENATILAGQSVDFQGSVTGGDAPFTYSWNFNGGANNASVEDPGSTTFSTAGTYTVTFSVTDNDGETASETVTIQVNGVPDTSPIASIASPSGSVTIDEGESVDFQGNVANGNGPFTYLWNFDGGAGNVYVEDPGSITFYTAGTYTVGFIVTDNDGDTDSATVTVQVDDIPDSSPLATITSPSGSVTIVQGQSVDFQGNVANGNGPFSYSWNFDSGASDSTAQNPGSVVFSTAGTYNVTFTVTDSDGDTDSDSVTITVAPDSSPIASITSPSGSVTIEEGQSVDFQGSVTNGNGPFTYLWNFNGGASNFTDEDPGSVVFSNDGTYNVTFTVTDSDGDTDNAAVTVTVDPLIVTAYLVDTTSPGPEDGLTWSTAFHTIQAAVDTAESAGGSEVWVAAGVYTSGSSDRDVKVIEMRNTVHIYGGFEGLAGAMETERSQRDYENNSTILDGLDTAYNVVYALNANDAILDGFTIMNGNADGAVDYRYGGGIYIYQSSLTISNCIVTENDGQYGSGMYIRNANPTLTDCDFTDNTATSYGGGIYNRDASPSLTDCTFNLNTATTSGGGIYNYDDSSPILTDCAFTENTAENVSGGAIYNGTNCSPDLTLCTFTNNKSPAGGAMYNHDCAPILTNCAFTGNDGGVEGGGIYNYEASPELTDCVFTENEASRGGGMWSQTTSLPILTDCTFNGNSATGTHGGGMYNSSGCAPTLTNCVFSDNTSMQSGGAMYSYYSGSYIKLTNCLFFENQSITGNGGAMYNQGSYLKINNSSFSVNNSITGNGGAMYNDTCDMTITNCIIWGNTAPSGAEISNTGSSTYWPTISYSNIQGCSLSGASWNTSFGTDNGGNIDSDPSFANIPQNIKITNSAGTTTTIEVIDASSYYTAGQVIEIDNDGVIRTISGISDTTVTFSPALSAASITDTIVYNWGTGATDLEIDLHLQTGSSCIDAGNNIDINDLDDDSDTSENLPILNDLDGNSRFVDDTAPDTGNGTAPIIDIGAYEY